MPTSSGTSGPRAATMLAVVPSYEPPIIATFPVDHGREARNFTTSIPEVISLFPP